ncbi:hypothetical protein GQ53DRAFT_835252 [Thozetella sp. PMI_491]|nr:hypothetical protein GQ53DRAFT_835252 [Thozetella sp. PMI_491]
MYSRTLLSGLMALTAAANALAAGLRLHSPPMTQMPQLLQKRGLTTTITLEPTPSILPDDPWQCITENITQYFDVPLPTGNVLDGINSYGDEVAKPCRATATGLDKLSCTVSDPKSWCGFTTAAPADVLSSYSTYVTAVASFLKVNNASMAKLSTSCPAAWALPDPGKQEWLKIAMAHGSCYLQAHPATDTTSLSTGFSTSTGISVPTTTTTGTAKATTTTSKAVAGRGQALDAFAYMSTGLAFLAGRM